MINLKQSFIILILVVITLSSHAQKKHFIYIQSEDKQPFYVMMQNKNYSSTLSGYLVIPKLKNGRYFFTAGFPKELYPEQHFSCVINDNDLGFSLKRFGNQGWGLFDYVSFTTIMANPTDWEKDKANYDTVKINMEDLASSQSQIKTNNSLEAAPTKTNTLNTTSTATTKSAVTEEATNSPKSEISINTKTSDVGVEAKNIAKTNETKTNPTPEVVQNIPAAQSSLSTITEPKTLSGITKTFQKQTESGLDQVYIDYTTTKADTITVFIPYISNSVIEASNSSDTSRPGSTSANQYNRSCVNLATEVDFNKIRRLMSAETTDDKMVQLAKNMLKNKCFTTEQIKKLGLLFISEQSRLKFFQIAKPSIYDVFNYASLETEFTIPSIIDLFRKTVSN